MPVTPISDINVSVLEVPFDKPIQSALGRYVGSDWVVVEMRAEDVVGYGYSMSLDRRGTKAVVSYIENELAPMANGQDAAAPEAVWQTMFAPNKARLRGGVGVHALSAVDTASWDVAARLAGVSLNRMIGGYAQTADVYGSGGWLSLSDEELVAEAQRHAANGITNYKLKIGGARDQARVGLLRREMGDDFTLYVDANQNFNVREAVAASAWLADFGVAWLEEPVLADSPMDMEAVAAESAIPIAAGENAYFRWGFRDLVERQAVTYLQPDIGRCGGVTEWIKIAHLADSYNLDLTSHLLHELSVGLIAAFPSGHAVEYMNFFKDNPFTQDFSVVDGKIAVPDVPGHGVEFDPVAHKKYRV
ncbi:MAG: mandelate racemase/muconate lactonizing enzyme family protein [Rhodospirillales bacterium]|nr:mandelate racemase/muconate lactonizing enzyme family protein [Rhodospirillales bacterium]